MNKEYGFKKDISIITITFIAFIYVFNIFIKSLNSTNTLNILLKPTMVGVIAILVYFFVNKIVLKIIEVDTISSSKLLLIILVGSNISLILGIMLLHFKFFSYTNLIFKIIITMNLPLQMICLLKDDLKDVKNLYKYKLILFTLGIMNIITSYLVNILYIS
ncbi:MAG: hypothetical protein R3Y64_07590 [Peptostreptococcaceae bacterium]